MNSAMESALLTARRYADGGEAQEPSFTDKARRTANGAAGVLDYYLAGIPSTVAGLLPWNSMADTKAKAEAARDDWRQMYGRGALEAAENPFNPAAGIILTLPMARRMPKRMLHPDDKGGPHRMEQVTEDLKAKVPQSPEEAAHRMDQAWQEHGVGIMPATDPSNIRPFTTYEAPGTKGLINPNVEFQSGPLKSIYDDPALYAVNPLAASQHTSIKIDPTLPHQKQMGSFQRSRGSDPGYLDVHARDAAAAENILKHEATHKNAARPTFELPQGSDPKREPAYIESGMTTGAVENIWKRIEDLVAKGRLNATQIDELARLQDSALPASRQMANYLDPWRNTGEWLARMEQILDTERRAGRNPFARPLTSYDDLDLRHLYGDTHGDLRVHRKYPIGD